MEINLEPEQINKIISELILKSKIGEEIQKSVDRVLKNLQTTYQNPFDAVITNAIGAQISLLIKDQYSEQIKQVLEKLLKDKLTPEYISEVFQKALHKY